jgi:hypothetical protein
LLLSLLLVFSGVGFKGCTAGPTGNQTLIDKIKDLATLVPGLPSVQIPAQLCYGTMSVYRVCAALAVCDSLMECDVWKRLFYQCRRGVISLKMFALV